MEPVKALVEAWQNAGSHPGYHREMQVLLHEQWPVLAKAIEAVVAASSSSD